MASRDAIVGPLLKVGNLVIVGYGDMLGVIISRHKTGWDPIYFVQIGENQYPFRHDELKVIG
jgi:hypothetical protein